MGVKKTWVDRVGGPEFALIYLIAAFLLGIGLTAFWFEGHAIHDKNYTSYYNGYMYGLICSFNHTSLTIYPLQNFTQAPNGTITPEIQYNYYLYSNWSACINAPDDSILIVNGIVPNPASYSSFGEIGPPRQFIIKKGS